MWTAPLHAPRVTSPRILMFLTRLEADWKYSRSFMEPVASAPAVLKSIGTRIAVASIGVATPIATYRHSNPTNWSPKIEPPSRNPMIIGLVAFPTCAPVRCAAIATPRLFGYLAARVPNAGACHRLVPNPTTATDSPRSHSAGLMPIRKYPSPTISMLADSIHATCFRYMSASIPAGRFAMPELTEFMVNIAPYAMSPIPRVALMNGIMTVSAPCPKCFTP